MKKNEKSSLMEWSRKHPLKIEEKGNHSLNRPIEIEGRD